MSYISLKLLYSLTVRAALLSTAVFTYSTSCLQYISMLCFQHFFISQKRKRGQGLRFFKNVYIHTKNFYRSQTLAVAACTYMYTVDSTYVTYIRYTVYILQSRCRQGQCLRDKIRSRSCRYTVRKCYWLCYCLALFYKISYHFLLFHETLRHIELCNSVISQMQLNPPKLF